MKVSPYLVIGASSLLAVVAVSLYFYETSPEIADAPPTPAVNVQVEQPTSEVDEAPAASSVSEEVAPIKSAEVVQPNDAIGINLARIQPDGSAVIAGNAPAGSTINLMEDGKIIGTTKASDAGEWVIIPDGLLAEGAHLLSVEIILPDGTKIVGSMALAVEIIAGGQDVPLVALVPYTEAATETATILQAPSELEATEVENIAKTDANNTETAPSAIMVPRLTIRSIQAISAGEMSLSGNAEAGVEVVLSVNGGKAVTATPDEKNMYAANLAIDPNAEKLKLRGRLNDENGVQVATVSLNLTRSQLDQSAGGNALIVVQKGDALWRIAYKTYGQGIRYVDIYRQNKSSINDPDLIYPDQIFVVPNGG